MLFFYEYLSLYTHNSTGNVKRKAYIHVYLVLAIQKTQIINQDIVQYLAPMQMQLQDLKLHKECGKGAYT